MADTGIIYIPIRAALYGEILMRMGKPDGAAAWVEGIVETYLDRTFGDAEIWGEEHAQQAELQELKWAAQREAFGDPRQGYQWTTLFLPNGTRLRMQYGGAQQHAAIRHEKLIFEGEALSPSQFAHKVAKGTTRNAWRDLYVQLPGQQGWQQADVLRKQSGRVR